MTITKWGLERSIEVPFLHWIGRASDNFPVKNFGLKGASGDLINRVTYVPGVPIPPYQPLTNLGMWLSDGSAYPPAIDSGYDTFSTKNDATDLEWSNNEFTLSCWFFCAGLVFDPCFLITKSVSQGTWNVPPYYTLTLSLNSARRPFVGIMNNSNGLVTAASATALTLGQWYHLLGVFDGAQLRLYVNSVLVATQSVITTIKWFNHGPWNIGRPYGNPSPTLPRGIIQDAKVFDKALNQTKISAEYDLPRFGS